MGRTLQLLVKRSGGKFSPHLIHFLIMKFFAIIAFVGYTQAFLVRREAAPEADADADAGYGYGAVSPAAVSAPVCNSVPEKVCKDRTIETPRKVCHTEHDEIVDTTITEHCEEVITTKCEQTSTQSRHSSAIVGQDSKVVATGVVASPEVTVAHGVPAHGGSTGYGAVATGPVVSTVGAGAVVGGVVGYGVAGYGKREAEADADADADAGYGYASPVATSAPLCNSVPVRTCNKVPVSTPRKIAKTVCKEVVDIKIIKDCTDTVSTICTQQSVQQSHSSAVVGADTRVGPEAVVATHGTVAVGAVAAPAVAVAAAPVVAGGVVAAYGGAAAPLVAGYAGTGVGLAGYAGY